MYKKYVVSYAEWEEKRHTKDPNHFQYARLKIYAPEESDLHKIILG